MFYTLHTKKERKNPEYLRPLVSTPKYYQIIYHNNHAVKKTSLHEEFTS